MHHPPPTSRPAKLGRRLFLLGTAAAVSGMALGPSSRLWAQQTADRTVHEMAQFLTGKPVDPELAKRAGAAISSNDPAFDSALAKLQSFIEAGAIADVEALQTADGFDDDLRATAKTLISALYLGYTGTPVAHSSVDDVRFVTFTQALTYQLTAPFTPIPSYSRWGSGYWADLPDAG